MADVVLEKLVKQFGDVSVVRGIDLQIDHNEFVVLVGPSGCGKSTTLRMIAGLEEITGGHVSIGGRVVNDLPPRQRNVSMVFQNYALFPHMTVRGNLSFGLKLAKRPAQEIESRVTAAAEILGLQGLLDRRPAQLSGGERQRVAMGRSLVRHPDVFLFDEPLSNLDAKLRTEMRTEIKRLHQKVETTVIYVTHDQVEAMTLADRIVIMRDGVIEQVGQPEAVFNEPANEFVGQFIGSPPMNLVDAVVTDGAGGPFIKLGEDWLLPVPSSRRDRVRVGMALRIGLRAEDLVPRGYGLPPGESWSFEGQVNISEPLGIETLLFVNLGPSEAISRMFNPKPVRQGEILTFDINLDRMHLFDRECGEAL